MRVNDGTRAVDVAIGAIDTEIDRYDKLIRAEFNNHPGYKAIQRIDGIGQVLAAVLTAELGDVSRFSAAPRVCSWAGLTPRHRDRRPRKRVRGNSSVGR